MVKTRSTHKIRRVLITNNHGPALSANTLFHFTSSIDRLEDILRNEFYPNYSLENWDNILDKPFEIAIPMVCFCDIPLSQIGSHAANYGEYALGMSKLWGMGNNICPVLYVHNKAATTGHIMDLFNQIDLLNSKYDLDPYNNDQYEEIDEEHIHKELDQSTKCLSLYMKPYQRKLKRQEVVNKDNVRFYDEREWRYIPQIVTDVASEEAKLFLTPVEYNDEELRNKETTKLISRKLSFNPDDIRYIIVSREDEILIMIDKVRRIKGKFSDDDVERLITRIISMEHIREDF